jgi:hypothetical protein
MTNPDPMAEDSLDDFVDELIAPFSIHRKRYARPHGTVARRQFANRAKKRLNAYTTNKIIEARIEEKLKAAGRLEALRKHGSRAESHLEKMIVVYVHEVAELKALNHRKER